MPVEPGPLKKAEIDWRLTRELRIQAMDLEPVVKKVTLRDLGSILQSLPTDFVADMRIVKEKLAYLPMHQNARVFAFCSSVPREGTSTLAHALTLTYAHDSAVFEDRVKASPQAPLPGNRGKILLIDANLHSPVLHEFMNVPREFGLVDYIEDEKTRSSVTKWIVPNRLALMTAGRPTEFGAHIFQYPRFKKLLLELRKDFQTIVFDCPPVALHPDILSFQDQIDGTLLVVNSGVTKVGDVLRTKLALERNGAKNIGVVLNRFESRIPAALNRFFD